MTGLKQGIKGHLMNFVSFFMELKQIAELTIATSNPPPKARPSTAATNGFFAAETKLIEQ